MELPANNFGPCTRYLVKHYDSATYQRNTNSVADVTILMLPQWPGAPLAEPSFLLVLTLDRLSPNAFEVFKRGEHFLNSDKFFGRGPSGFHATVSESVVTPHMEQRTYRCFRKDIALPGGDVVVAGAHILEKPDVVPDLPGYIEAARSMLESVAPIAPQ
jgi:hypothetical protein